MPRPCAASLFSVGAESFLAFKFFSEALSVFKIKVSLARSLTARSLRARIALTKYSDKSFQRRSAAFFLPGTRKESQTCSWSRSVHGASMRTSNSYGLESVESVDVSAWRSSMRQMFQLKSGFQNRRKEKQEIKCNAVLRAARAVNSAVILSASLIVLIDRRMMYFEPPHGLFLGSLFFYLATLMYRILMEREARANAHRRSDAKK